VLRIAASRARQTAIVAFIVTTLAFVLIHAAPGDPFASVDATPESQSARDEMRRHYGLDRPLYIQYPVMLANFARGDFGTSFFDGRPVRELLASVIPDTLLLMFPALVIGVLLGVALGTWQGWRAGGVSDRVASALTIGFLSVPEFLFGLVASIIFAVRLGWLPAAGMLRVGGGHAGALALFSDYLAHAILPVGTLALAIACAVARFQRTAVIAARDEEFVRTARAKGAATSRILLGHVLPRTAGSLCAVLGLLFPTLVGGAALVEVVFGWPGAGSALVGAVSSRDYPVVIALVTVGSVAVCVGSALADIAAARLNPAAGLES
jgi:peptide/nickel transport system permease protein